MALSTSADVGDLREAMADLYGDVVAPFAARNPLGAKGACEAAERAERAAQEAAAKGKRAPPLAEEGGGGQQGALATEPFFAAVDAFLRERGLLQAGV